jgi:sulfite exporter TauE/SafE
MNMEWLSTLAAALALGAMGSVHCIGMCGGIAGALSIALPPEQRTRATLWTHQLGYALGRIASYGVAGAFAGSVGLLLADTLGPRGALLLRAAAAALLLMLGLQLGGWWRGLGAIERLGAAVWRWIAPTVDPTARGRSLLHAVGVGAAWGWLPCGLVYGTLAWAAAGADPIRGALIMVAFGLGTVPAVSSTGVAAARATQRIQSLTSRRVAGAVIMSLAVWTAVAAGMHGGATPACHTGAHDPEHSSAVAK